MLMNESKSQSDVPDFMPHTPYNARSAKQVIQLNPSQVQLSALLYCLSVLVSVMPIVAYFECPTLVVSDRCERHTQSDCLSLK